MTSDEKETAPRRDRLNDLGSPPASRSKPTTPLGRASSRRLDSYLFGVRAQTFAARPESSKQIATMWSLPTTGREWSDAVRRGYCYASDIRSGVVGDGGLLRSR